MELIRQVISNDGVSQLAWSWQWFMSKEEYSAFVERGHLRAICEHIVFASYVAVESYLVGKFQEYFAYKYSALNEDQRGSVLKKVSMRSLDEIKRQYFEFLDANISRFEPEVGVYSEAPWFHPNSGWEGLKMLEACRNSLAHRGEMKDVKLVVLVDAWSAHEFCREWVEYFEDSYNDFIYRNRPIKFEEPI